MRKMRLKRSYLIIVLIVVAFFIASRYVLSDTKWVYERATSVYGYGSRWHSVEVLGYYPNDIIVWGRAIKYYNKYEPRDWALGYVDVFGNVHITYENYPPVEPKYEPPKGE